MSRHIRPCSVATSMYIVAAITAAAHAQSGFADWLGARPGSATPKVTAESRGYFSAESDRGHHDVHMDRQTLSLSIPFVLSETDEVLWRMRIDHLSLGGDMWLPYTFDELPNSLWDITFGKTWRHKLNNGWTAGADISLGSKSDKPYASGDEITLTLTGFVRVPHGQNNAWLFMLNYSNEREFARNIPIPGVAYQFNAGPKLQGLAGLPFSMIRWQPVDRVELKASYFIPRTIKARASYELVDDVRLYASFAWDNDRWFRADRNDDDDRLFYYEKRVMAGVRWDITEQLYVDFGAGYAFDRLFFEGEDYGDRHDSRVSIDDTPILLGQVCLEF